MEEKTSNKRASRTLASAVAAATLAAALVPAAALAAPVDVNHDTAVKLYNESGQVTVVVPTAIPAAIAGADGSFVTAPNAAKFKNEGVFDVHVSKIGVTAASGVNLVAEKDFDGIKDTENTVWAAVAPGTGQKVDLADYVTTAKAPAVADQWEIKGASELAINLEGAMKEPGATFVAADSPASAPVAFTITWTVAAGAAS